MRILQIIPTLTVGGAERMLANLTRHLHRRGHEVEVVSMYAPLGSWIEADLRQQGLALHFLSKRPGPDLRMVGRIGQVVRRFRPEVVHTHMYTLKYALPAIRRQRVPRAVHTMHTVAEVEAGRLGQLVQRYAFRHGVLAVAIGDAVAATFAAAYGMRPTRTIPNGIPVEAYAAPPGARDALRAELGIDAGAPVFVTVGQFVEAKNHPLLLRAFAAGRLHEAGAHLLLAGDGVLRAPAEELARALGCADRVHFLGVRPDVPRVLAAADVFVLSSQREGNPLAVMEAMAAGKPVLATSVGCVPELVEPGTGTLVASGDETALAAELDRYARDPARAAAEGALAAQRARERFDDAVMATAYEELYREGT